MSFKKWSINKDTYFCSTVIKFNFKSSNLTICIFNQERPDGYSQHSTKHILVNVLVGLEVASETEVAYQVVQQVSSFARSTKRSLRANKTVKSLRWSPPALLGRYVLISFIAENERSHDTEVTGMVSVIWMHLSKFTKSENAAEGVSLDQTVSMLHVETRSPTSCFSNFNAINGQFYTATTSGLLMTQVSA